MRSYSYELIEHWEICESITDWLDICLNFLKSSQFASLQSQSALWNKLMGGQLYRAPLLTEVLPFFFFVSHWLNSELKAKRLISSRKFWRVCFARNLTSHLELSACIRCQVLPLEAESQKLMACQQTVQRLLSEQNWFIIFSYMVAHRYD